MFTFGSLSRPSQWSSFPWIILTVHFSLRPSFSHVSLPASIVSCSHGKLLIFGVFPIFSFGRYYAISSVRSPTSAYTPSALCLTLVAPALKWSLILAAKFDIACRTWKRDTLAFCRFCTCIYFPFFFFLFWFFLYYSRRSHDLLETTSSVTRWKNSILKPVITCVHVYRATSISLVPLSTPPPLTHPPWSITIDPYPTRIFKLVLTPIPSITGRWNFITGEQLGSCTVGHHRRPRPSAPWSPPKDYLSPPIPPPNTPPPQESTYFPIWN